MPDEAERGEDGADGHRMVHLDPDAEHTHQEERQPPRRHAHFEGPGMGKLGFDAFGVGITVVAPPEVLSRARTILPPGSRERESREDDEFFYLRPQENQVYTVVHGFDTVSGSSDLQIALEVLDSRLRLHVATESPNHIFIHAGVVGHGGRAIVIPGKAFSGKTTLITELVRAGATYYSDEFAVLDETGLVHPYPKPLSIRSDTLSQVDHAVEAIGGIAGSEPLPIGLVAATVYWPGSQWEPQQLSSGEAALALLENAIPAQTRAEQAMSVISKAVDGAVALRGHRDEAATIVPHLLATLKA
jgi:hypothetical protein